MCCKYIETLLLYFSADGDFAPTKITKVKAEVHHHGLIVWKPMINFKPLCEMNVEFFPFDIQNCSLKFSAWEDYSLVSMKKSYKTGLFLTCISGFC